MLSKHDHDKALENYARRAARNKAIEAHLAQPHRWRDGKGLVHELRAHVAYNLTVQSGQDHLFWTPACGKQRQSNRECSPDAPVTCILCATAPKTEFRCVCGHYAFEHTSGEVCDGCEASEWPGFHHPYTPDYRNPVVNEND